jgi:hypothetical protein
VRTLAPPDRKPRVRRARLHHDVSAAASHSKSDASATAGVKKRTSSREREGVRYAAVCRGAAEVVTQMRDCLRPAPKIRDRCHELFAFSPGLCTIARTFFIEMRATRAKGDRNQSSIAASTFFLRSTWPGHAPAVACSDSLRRSLGCTLA